MFNTACSHIGSTRDVCMRLTVRLRIMIHTVYSEIFEQNSIQERLFTRGMCAMRLMVSIVSNE